MSSQPTLNYDGEYIGRIEVANVSGQRSLDGGRLIFNCRIQMPPRPAQQIRFTDVGGDLMLADPGAHIGRLFAFNGVHGETSERGGDHHVTVAAHLSSVQLAALERIRTDANVGNLRLELRLGIYMHGPPGPRTGQAWIAHSISQSDWLECLRGMRFETRVLFEVPTEGGRLGGALSTAAEHYRRALALQHQANWPQVVGECRSVLEELRNALQLQNPPAAEWLPGQRAHWGLRTRIEHGRASIHHICHLANHPGIADDPTAEDARLVMALTGALLRYYAERGSP